MPRTISAGLEAAIASGVIYPATLVKITRKDGEILGFTSSDQDLTYDSQLYKASDGISMSSLEGEVGTGVDNLDVQGFLTDARITEADLVAGLYRGARVEIMIVDRDDLTNGHMGLLSGVIGEITLIDGEFTAEVRSLSQLLKQTVGDTLTPTCRCKRVGDAQCGVTIGSYTFTRTVGSAPDADTIVFGGDVHATGYFDAGMIRFTSGLNDGIERQVKTHTNSGSNATCVLRESFPFAVAPGDTAEIEAGCMRRFTEDCVGKFGNGARFRGYHLLPGNDKVMQVGRQPS